MASDSLSADIQLVCYVQADGKALSDNTQTYLYECVVDESIYLPTACMLRFFVDPTQDGGLRVVDESALEEGNTLEVKLGYKESSGADETGVVFKGEIVGVDLDLNAMGVSTFTVRAMDKSHRMHIGVNQKVFLQVTDSDVIEQVLRDNGLTAEVTPTTAVRDWIVQNNQSDWDFVKHLAWRNGMHLYMNRSEKVVGSKFSHSTEEVVLEWQENLLAFRPRTAATQQVEKVKLRSWDMKTKSAVVGLSKGQPSVPSPAEGIAGAKAAKLFDKSQPTTICGFPLFDQSSADAMADSLYQAISAEYLKADALCKGNHHITPGVKVEFKGVGTKFSGKYLVTTATHVYGAKAGYTTQISFDGGFGAGVDSLMASGGVSPGSGASTANGAVSASLTGANLQVCVGIVTNNMDEENLGRVKVKYPFLAEESESYWARIATPMAGKDRGFFYLPEVDDEVLVAFEHGDMQRPFVIGSLWNGEDSPPQGNDDAVVANQVVHRLIKTRIGHSLLFDDTDELGEIISTTKGNHSFTLNDKDKVIRAKTTGGHVLELDDQNQKVHVKTTGGLEMTMDDVAQSITLQDSTGNKIVINGSSSEIDITSMGNINIKAMAQISIQGTGGVSIMGPTVSVNADADLTLQAGGDGTLMSTGELTIQGTMVMIN